VIDVMMVALMMIPIVKYFEAFVYLVKNQSSLGFIDSSETRKITKARLECSNHLR
jgi:hypothetical protein